MLQLFLDLKTTGDMNEYAGCKINHQVTADQTQLAAVQVHQGLYTFLSHVLFMPKRPSYLIRRKQNETNRFLLTRKLFAGANRMGYP